jgi:two-component system sensor histidine kinase BarA
VALTAHVIGTAADAWREAGMDGVLHKPFTLARLAEVIATHAGVRPEAAAATSSAGETNDHAATVAVDTSVLDDLLSMAGGATVVVDRITGLYRSQSQERIGDIRAAVEAGDLDRLGKAAHALKSMSFNVGARLVAEAAAQIERTARLDGRMVEVDDVDRLTAHCDHAVQEIDEWRRRAA